MNFPKYPDLKQYAGQLCAKTCINIIKGAIHAVKIGAIVGAGDAAIGYAQTYLASGAPELSNNPLVLMALTSIAGSLYNAWREYKKGIALPAPASVEEEVTQ